MVTVAALVGATGLTLRWWVAASAPTAESVDSATAVSAGVQAARAVAEGRMVWFLDVAQGHRPGALGAIILGVAIRLLGEPTAVPVMAVALGVVAAVLMVLAVRRRLAGPWPYVAAAVWSAGSSVWITAGRDPTDPVVFTVLLGLILLALVESDRAPWWWAVGLVLGIGWWTSALMTIAAAPAVVVLIARRTAPHGLGWAQLIGGVVIGALARLVDEVRSGFPMLRAHGAWPDDPTAHLRSRPLTSVGAALGLTGDDGAWLLPAGRWVALGIVAALGLTVITVLIRQPRSRSALLVAAPVMVALDLAADGWDLAAHSLAPLLGPAVAVATVIALSAAPAGARPSLAVVVLIVVAVLGATGVLLDRDGDQEGGAGARADANAESSAVTNALEEYSVARSAAARDIT